ncbi:MAG: hypothetical protein RJA76_1645 [Bacteroidota bacterium]|jgi:NAD(P)-dependent dehydrogenase (short-subunit alcohol dehydrogenase family)
MGTFVIVGGSKGIGRQISIDLMKQGHKILNFSRTPSSLNGVENYFWDAESDTYGVFKEIQGALDGLVYCPGTISLKPFNRITAKDFEKDLKINFLSAIGVIQALLNPLKSAESSSILLFSTVAVQTGMNFHASIASAKGAVEGLTKSLAAEFASSNIRVNAIAPSLTQTDLAASLTNTPDKIEASAKRHPLNRIGQTADISGLACLLLSNENNWITGQIIHVDGGLSTLKPL